MDSSKPTQAYNNRPLLPLRDQLTDSKGDFPFQGGFETMGSDPDVGSISSQRGRRAVDPINEVEIRRRNDNYNSFNYNQPPKDTLGWNALIDEGCNAWKAVIAEFLGVLVLVFIGCGSCVNWGRPGEPNVLQIAFAFGTARATVCTVIGHISGTHVNPAVTIGLCIGKKITPAKAVFYIVFQVLGAIIGAVLLNFAIPDSLNDGLGQTHPGPHVTKWQAILVEAIITFLLTLTVFAVCDELRKDIKGSAPLMIGFVIMTCHIMAIPITGSSMNPARSTGPAVVMNNFEHLWIYWVGPIIGAIFAGIFYILLLHKEEEDAVKIASVNARATGPQPDPASYQYDPATPIGISTASNQSVA